MKNKKHQKHAKIARPDLGFFARNEWAIIGTPCGNIQTIAFQVIENLSAQFKVAYVDADHHSPSEGVEHANPTNALEAGAVMNYTDKVDFHNFAVKASYETYQYRTQFNDQDLVIINGNHFEGREQIVVVDPRKTESLQRKLDRLTNVSMILLEEGVSEIPDYLKDKIENLEKLPIYKTSETRLISVYLKERLEEKTPPISGLILAGGQSTRMGQDKGMINYRGMPHRAYLHRLLSNFCEDVFISCRHDQLSTLDGLPALADTFVGLGPFSALLSAFRERPGHAWVVIACDYPLLDRATILQLLTSRNPSKFATAFKSTNNEFPEPLVTLWEPRSYPELLRFLSQGYSCPRKVLINTDIQLLEIENPEALRNVNEPNEMKEIIDLLASKS